MSRSIGRKILKSTMVGLVLGTIGIGVYHGFKYPDKLKEGWNNFWDEEQTIPNTPGVPDTPDNPDVSVEPEEPLTYTIKFTVDEEETSQTIANGGYATVPEEPYKQGYIFLGWSVDGQTVVEDVSTYTIKADTTFVALFEEITTTSASLFTFENGVVTSYIGEDLYVKIPETYSLGETKTVQKQFTDVSELYSHMSDNGLTTLTITDSEGNQIEVTQSSIWSATISYPVTASVEEQTYIDGTDYTVTELGQYIFRSSSVKQVILPSTLTTIQVQAFYQCNNIKEMIIPKSVTKIHYNSFMTLNSIERYVVEEGNTVYDSRDNCNSIIETATNTFFAGAGKSIIPNTVTAIGEHAFYNKGPKEIVLPDTVTTLNRYSFSYCKGLEKVTLGKGITNIPQYAFNQCSDLKEIVFSNTLKTIEDYAFQYCDGLTEISLPEGVESLGKKVFGLCKNLEKVILPSTLKTMGDEVFYVNNKIAEVVLNSTTLPTIGTKILSNANKDCKIYVVDELYNSYLAMDSLASYTSQIYKLSEKEN